MTRRVLFAGLGVFVAALVLTAIFLQYLAPGFVLDSLASLPFCG